jgi:hypothetical protein
MKCFWGVVILVLFACMPAVVEGIMAIEELERKYEVATCIKCHENNGPQWSESLHATSLADPRILNSLRSFIKDSNKETGVRDERQRVSTCFYCHAPQAADVSNDLVEHISDLIITAVESSDSINRETAIKKLSTLNVSCRVCHMMRGMPEDTIKPDTLYGPGWDEDEIAHKRDYGYETVGSDYLMSSKICTSCHKSRSEGTLSFQFLKHHENTLEHCMDKHTDKTCQSCHMQENGTTSHKFKRNNSEL